MSDQGEIKEEADGGKLMHSFTEEWVKKHRPFRNPIACGMTSGRVLITVLIVALLVICLVVIVGVMVYHRITLNYESNIAQINNLKAEYARLQYSVNRKIASARSVQTTRKTRPPKTALAHKPVILLDLCGNDELITTDPNRPIHNWKKKIHNGDIEFQKNFFIRIQTPGIYQVQVQMFFYKNEEYFRKANMNITTLDFHIKKGRSTVLARKTVPLTECKKQCVRSISRIFVLEKKAQLSIQSDISCQFKMLHAASHFTVHKL
ncbi:uncharacterized protein LOC130621719 [Hydractinia symbiolongicarpus]|uniref:uncharacterized protein LOC130621719 n=1 Tax=Hydractinia symbiolongicarpus TaxID=13093 RepID=UPI00254C6656|nr:uncharacterized protein LOC130621719 [Hydractinia symbiolongicarpus]